MKGKRKKIHIFGNPLLKLDSLPLRLVKQLQQRFPEVDFVVKDPNENLWPTDGALAIIDTSIGIKQVELLTDLSKIETGGLPCSLHDFDLAFNLKLLQKIGQLRKITIFAVPQKIGKKAALDQLTESIQEYLQKTS